MKPNPATIIEWIESQQKGLAGIYPHKVALEVCAEFGINMNNASELVITHIKDVLNAEFEKEKTR